MDGTWNGSGALEGDTLTVTQSGDNLMGSVSGGLVGPVSGTNESGNVSLLLALGVSPGENSIPLGRKFSGHFVNAVTVIGTMVGTDSVVTLTRSAN
jgi:hypothetical protein